MRLYTRDLPPMRGEHKESFSPPVGCENKESLPPPVGFEYTESLPPPVGYENKKSLPCDCLYLLCDHPDGDGEKRAIAPCIGVLALVDSRRPEDLMLVSTPALLLFL